LPVLAIINLYLFYDLTRNYSHKKLIWGVSIFGVSIYIVPWVALLLPGMMVYALTEKELRKYGYLMLTSLIIGIVALNFNFLGWLHIPVTQFMPTIERWKNVLFADAFTGVHFYLKIFYYDFNFLFIFAMIGSIVLFRSNRKAFKFLMLVFTTYFCLLSFVVLEFAQRYLLIVYPVYLIFASTGVLWLASKFSSKSKYVVIFSIGICIIMSPLSKYTSLFNHETVVGKSVLLDENFNEYTFYSYREPCIAVKKLMGSSDVIISTMPRIQEFYTGRDAFSLRQVVYVPDENKNRGVIDTTLTDDDLSTHRNFIHFLKKYTRGWAILDARIGVMISPETLLYLQNEDEFMFHDQISNESVIVLSWGI